MRVLYAEFTAKPGHEAETSRLILEFADVVRQEPGNLRFEVYVRSDDTSRFFVFEQYRDEAAFQAHLNAPAGAVLNEALEHHIVEPHSQLTLLEEPQ